MFVLSCSLYNTHKRTALCQEETNNKLLISIQEGMFVSVYVPYKKECSVKAHSEQVLQINAYYIHIGTHATNCGTV